MLPFGHQPTSLMDQPQCTTPSKLPAQRGTPLRLNVNSANRLGSTVATGHLITAVADRVVSPVHHTVIIYVIVLVGVESTNRIEFRACSSTMFTRSLTASWDRAAAVPRARSVWASSPGYCVLASNALAHLLRIMSGADDVWYDSKYILIFTWL